MKLSDFEPYLAQHVRRTPLLYGWRDTPALLAVQDESIELLDEFERDRVLMFLMGAMYPGGQGCEPASN